MNATTRRWRQLPDMAANVVLNFTSMNRTGDGRLCSGLDHGLGDVVAV